MGEDQKGRTIIGTSPGSRPRPTTGAPHPGQPPGPAPEALPRSVAPASSAAIPAPQVWLDLAHTKLELREFDAALDALEHALCLDLSVSGRVSPTLSQYAAERIVALGYLHRLQETGDRIATLDQLRRLSLRFPDYTPILFNYAVELARAGAIDLARAMARRTVEQSPTVIDAFPADVRRLLGATPQHRGLHDDARVGATLGGYRVLRVATAAPSHVLYDAIHASNRTAVTLRRLCQIDPGKARGLFEDQAAAADAPPPPGDPRRHVVRALGVVDDGEGPLQVLERIRGRTVYEAFAIQPRTPEDIDVGVHLVWLVARLAAELHARTGFVHGQLGPDHVLFVDDDIEQPIRLVDTGLDVRRRLGAGTLPLPLGRDPTASPAGEVYGLGVLLHYVVTGALPDPAQLRQGRLAIQHDRLRRVAWQCLSDGDDRLRDAAMVADALEDVFVAPAAPVGPGKQLDQWRIESAIGTDRFATLYRARHVSIAGQSAALRVLRPAYVHRRDVRHRFEREAAITPHHPGIAEVWPRRSFLTGTPYCAMKLLDGQRLRDRLAAGPIPAPSVIDWGLELAEALAYSHKAGVFHLDLSPDSVIVLPPGSARHVKLQGFGVGEVRSARRGADDRNAPHSPPAYLAPEQLTAAEDPRQLGQIDVYALGVMLTEMLSGAHPLGFEGNQPYRRLIGPDHFAPLEPVIGSARKNLEFWLGEMTAERPDARPSMQGALLALQQIARSVPGTSAYRTIVQTPAMAAAAARSRRDSLPGHGHPGPRGARLEARGTTPPLDASHPGAGPRGSICDGGSSQATPATPGDPLERAAWSATAPGNAGERAGWPATAPGDSSQQAGWSATSPSADPGVPGAGMTPAPPAGAAWSGAPPVPSTRPIAPSANRAAQAATGPTAAAIAPRRRGRRALLAVGVIGAAAAVIGVAIWQSPGEVRPGPQTAKMPTTVAVPVPAPTQPPPAPAEKPLDYDALRKDAQLTLRAALHETEPAVRVQGSDALARVKDQASTPALTELTERDPDDEVRGHTAEALGEIRAHAAVPLLARLESAGAPPLKVWYASALARLGDRAAARRLLSYARSRDLAVAFKAGLTLAEITPPGSKPANAALAALKTIAAHEAELSGIAPYAGALILMRMAALRDASARKLLYGILDHHDEGARLAAAEGLARLGDDAGKKVLADVLANPASPNRLVAAIAQIPLGEYGGLDVITARLDDRDPAVRRLAARGLGEIGERTSVPRLVVLARDRDWTVRIAAAAAIVAIVGLEPQVLAQASVDWTRSALDSQDLAVRRAAAGVLADIPVKDAVPLLAQAIADPDPNVRLAASRSAGKIKSTAAASEVADAMNSETDPQVKEQQVKSLGEIGAVAGGAAHDTLARISEQPGRLGVLAAGALIAVGDTAGTTRLDAAAAAPSVELRLTAMQAAGSAGNPIVVPILKVGVLDAVFDVKFAAAEGLAAYNVEKAAAVPVLTRGLGSPDPGIVGRAIAALTRLGESLAALTRSPTEMLESSDARLRLAVVSIARAASPGDGVALLRRLVADPDQDVRRAGVEAIADLAARNEAAAIRLYKPLVNDADPMVRSKASGQLSRLVRPPLPPPPAPAAPAVPSAAPSPDPAPDDTMTRVQPELDKTTAAVAEVQRAGEAADALATELAAALAKHAHDDATLARVAELKKHLDDAPGKLDAATAAVQAAAQAAAEAGGADPSPDARKKIEEAKAAADTARSAASAARDRAITAAASAAALLKAETSAVSILIASADTETATGNFAAAKYHLDKAAKQLRESATKDASLDHSYAQLYDRMATREADPAVKRKLLQQAVDAYQRFAAAGTGTRVQRARDRRAELAEELKQLSP
jgi:HEAT repeat protein